LESVAILFEFPDVRFRFRPLLLKLFHFLHEFSAFVLVLIGTLGEFTEEVLSFLEYVL